MDDAGWLHTGDVVYRDNDGNLIFVDRIKSLIKCDAKHVQPSEIENMILQVCIAIVAQAYLSTFGYKVNSPSITHQIDQNDCKTFFRPTIKSEKPQYLEFRIHFIKKLLELLLS